MSLWRCGVSSENSTGNGNAMVPWLKRHWVGWLAEWLVIPLIPLIWVELYAAIYMMVMVGLDGNAWCWAKQLSNVWIWQVTHKCWIKTKRDSSSVVGSGELDKARVLGEFFDVFCRDGLVGRDGSKLGTSGPDWTPAPDSTRPCLKCLCNFSMCDLFGVCWRFQEIAMFHPQVAAEKIQWEIPSSRIAPPIFQCSIALSVSYWWVHPSYVGG